MQPPSETKIDGMERASEKHLLDLLRSGHAAAADELFRRHYSTSLRICRRMLAGAEAEDAVQSAYCSAFEHLASFRGESSFRTWITRIVVNRCLATARALASRDHRHVCVFCEPVTGGYCLRGFVAREVCVVL